MTTIMFVPVFLEPHNWKICLELLFVLKFLMHLAPQLMAKIFVGFGSYAFAAMTFTSLYLQVLWQEFFLCPWRTGCQWETAGSSVWSSCAYPNQSCSPH